MNKYVLVILAILILNTLMSPSTHAHLMVAQHGTLNFVDDGVFMVLSLPISAFGSIDENNDGKVPMIEFNNHRATIIELVGQNVTLKDKEGNLPLEGIMLSPVVPHDAPNQSISQLIVMGRFALADADDELCFQVDLFGRQQAEQVLEITATRKLDSQEHSFKLNPGASAGMLFAD